MRLYIAEKPSLAKAIAQGLGGGKQGDACIVCGDNTVTWAFGHLLELFDPDEYDANLKRWDRNDLPIIPAVWKVKPKSSTKRQLVAIGKMLKAAKSVVHAGDPDREGQLLIDEILEHFSFKGKVDRLWLASLDTASVAKALGTIKPNEGYAPMRDAARARSRADWLIGMNATRAMTLFGGSSGSSGVLSLGRVQTPTLNLVVERDSSIEYFKAQEYLVLQAHVQHSQGGFTATFSPSDSQAGLDPEKRLVDAAIAAGIIEAAAGKEGCVSQCSREEKKQAPPLPHCLSSLQKLASAKYGMTAQSVLDVAQKLYDQGFATYPRSDCRYLPDEQFADAPSILGSCLDKVDCTLRSAAWNTTKITAHHAIIPTKQSPSSLSADEQKIYDLIFQAYMQQFQKPLHYVALKIVVNIADHAFTATGRHILDAGYTADMDADTEKDDANEAENLPSVQQGDMVICSKVDMLAKKTKPSPRFTEGTLIDAMAHIDRYITDNAARATLKENAGIGTEATRANILETLKKRGYIKADKKNLVSTDLGKQLIALCPPVLKDPVTTALWEQQLENIVQGSNTLEQFMAAQTQALPAIIQAIFNNTAAGEIAPQFPCPACGKGLLRKNGKKGFFWGCAGYPACTASFPDAQGKPNTKASKPKAALTSEFPCPTCGKPLVKHNGTKGVFWGCSGYRECGCRTTLQDACGKPDFEGK